MGFRPELNWVLRILLPENIHENKIFTFSKDGHRIYPINMPIDLISRDWISIAKIVVIESKIIENRTEGKFKVVKIYKGQEKEILTNYWRENLQIIKGRKIEDFDDISGVSVT